MRDEPLSLDDDEVETEQKRVPALVWIGIGLAGILVMFGTYGMLAWLVPRHREVVEEVAHEQAEERPAPRSSPPVHSSPPVLPGVSLPDRNKPVPGKKYYLREEFRTLVMGKTQDEILKLLGKPARTDDEGIFGQPGWHYSQLTVDPISEKVDFSAWIRFKDGKVVRVTY